MSTEQALFLEQLKLYYDIAKHIGTLDVALLVGFAAFLPKLIKNSRSCSDELFPFLSVICFGISLLVSAIAIVEITSRISTLDFANSNYMDYLAALTLSFLAGVILISISFLKHLARGS